MNARSSLKAIGRRLVAPIRRLRQPLAKHYWRHAIARRNLDYLRWRFIANCDRSFLARVASVRNPEARQIGHVLRTDGIALGPAAQFLSDAGRRALADASTAVMALTRGPEVEAILAGRKSNHPKDYLISLTGPHYAADSPLLRVALDVTLLEIVSLYLGMWPRLYSISAWLNFPTDAEANNAQLWHRDPEDLQVVKAFIYLVDVDDDRGPFCYIPGSHPFGRAAATIPAHTDRIRVSDAEMTAAFPHESWRVCTGPANTMILADTLGFHRGGKPANGHRILITFTFTSGRPFKAPDFHVAGAPAWITDRIQRYAL